MSLKLLVNTPEIWKAFDKELDIRISAVHTQMEQVLDTNSFYRLQGQAFAFRKLKQLRDQVNGST